MSDPDERTLLTAVACVLRTAAPSVGALPHVARMLDELLDETVLLTPQAAVVVGSTRLLDRVLRRIREALDFPFPGCVETEIALGAAIQVAVAKGRLDLAERIHRVHPGPLSTRLLRSAARRGDVPMLRWLLTHRSDGLCVPDPLGGATVSCGHLTCCLREVYREALNHGQLGVIRWLFDQGHIGALDDAGDAAAASGDLDMVQWVHAQNYRHAFSSAALDKAASEGHLPVVRFLVQNRPEKCTVVGLTGAQNGGHDEVVSLLHKTGKIIEGKDDAGAMVVHAAAAGRLDVLQARPRRDQERRLYEFALYAAAEYGHVHVVDWITNELRVPFPPMARARAAGHGQLSILQWAHAQGAAQWSIEVMSCAAAENRMEVVQWLHDNRTDSCSTAAMNRAATNGHLEMVRWLHANRSEGCTAEAMNGAAYGGHLGVVQWLHSNRQEGCTVEAMDEAARNGHLEVVKWLHCNRSEGCTERAIDGAARGGHLAILEFLHEHRDEGCSWEAAVAAAISGHRYIVEWLRDRYPLVYDAARVADASNWRMQ